MSAQSGFPEVKGPELDAFLEDHPRLVLFIKDRNDTTLDPMMKTISEERPRVAVAWMAKDPHASHRIGQFRISGAYNVVIFYAGQPVKRLMGIPPMDCLKSAVADALSGVKASPSPER